MIVRKIVKMTFLSKSIHSVSPLEIQRCPQVKLIRETIMGIYDIEDKKPKMSQKERDEMMKKFLDKGEQQNTEIKT